MSHLTLLLRIAKSWRRSMVLLEMFETCFKIFWNVSNCRCFKIHVLNISSIQKVFFQCIFQQVSWDSPVPNPNKIPWCLKGSFASLFRAMPRYCGLYKEEYWILLIHLSLREKVCMKFSSSFLYAFYASFL